MVYMCPAEVQDLCITTRDGEFCTNYGAWANMCSMLRSKESFETVSGQKTAGDESFESLAGDEPNPKRVCDKTLDLSEFSLLAVQFLDSGIMLALDKPEIVDPCEVINLVNYLAAKQLRQWVLVQFMETPVIKIGSTVIKVGSKGPSCSEKDFNGRLLTGLSRLMSEALDTEEKKSILDCYVANVAVAGSKWANDFPFVDIPNDVRPLLWYSIERVFNRFHRKIAYTLAIQLSRCSFPVIPEILFNATSFTPPPSVTGGFPGFIKALIDTRTFPSYFRSIYREYLNKK